VLVVVGVDQLRVIKVEATGERLLTGVTDVKRV
jgi:hypothetical protein